MSAAPTNILDCTLRDGGYYTNWCFDQATVLEYLGVCHSAGIDVIEVGYVKLTADDSGPYGCLPDCLPAAVANELHAKKTPLAVMLDAKSALAFSPAIAAEKLHRVVSNIPGDVSLVRLAVNYALLEDALDLIEAILGAGLRASINLMQIDLASDGALETCLRLSESLSRLTAVYIADSLGSMMPERVDEMVKEFRRRVAVPIGFHAHDNQGLALHNSLIAVSAGATWVDGTMLGMGRGAGNAKTENLIRLLRRADLDCSILDRLLARHFVPLWEVHRWGPSVYYGIAGARRVHPTYVQNLEREATLEVSSKIEILEFLAKENATAYSPKMFQNALRRVA